MLPAPGTTYSSFCARLFLSFGTVVWIMDGTQVNREEMEGGELGGEERGEEEERERIEIILVSGW